MSDLAFVSIEFGVALIALWIGTSILENRVNDLRKRVAALEQRGRSCGEDG